MSTTASPTRCPRRSPGEQRSRSRAASSAPRSSTSPTREFLPALGVHLAPYRGYDPDVEPDARERVRDGRLPGAQHGARRVRADVAAGDVQRRRRCGVRVEPGIEVEDDGDGDVDARRSRSPSRSATRTSASRSASGRRCRASASGSTATTSRSTTRSAACCSRCRSRASRIRACAASRSSTGLLQRRRGPRRRRHPARPRPRHAALQRPAAAYGLPPRPTFTDITGESTDALPGGARPANDPDILDFVSLRDDDGNPVPLGDSGRTPSRASGAATLAARLKAIYGDVDKVDAFVGMVAEKHVRRNRVRRAAARDLEAAVRRPARRRPLLLRKRRRAGRDQARLRDRLPGQPGHDHQAEQRRGSGRRRLQGRRLTAGGAVGGAAAGGPSPAPAGSPAGEPNRIHVRGPLACQSPA